MSDGISINQNDGTRQIETKPWPQTWEHKENRKRVRVMPWWECLEPILADNDDFGATAMGKAFSDGRKMRIGALVQIGWLLENEHGVWFGVAPEAEQAFNTEPQPECGAV